MSLRVNPEYEKLLPKMSNEEYSELKVSIQEEGQHYPIVANEDLVVLDGHHRFRACAELGIEPDFEVRKFEDKIIEKKFVIEANLRRRHLTKFQLVELAIPLLEIEKALAKKRQVQGGKNGRNVQMGVAPIDAKPIFQGKATEAVARRVGVSTRTLERGKKIVEKASEEDKQKLREGKTSISKVYREVSTPKLLTDDLPKLTISSVKEHNDEALRENKKLLAEFLSKLEKEQVYCPFCQGHMFECNQCHKTIKDALRK
jgi:ParB-like chromosome segregation protein Spo0J